MSDILGCRGWGVVVGGGTAMRRFRPGIVANALAALALFGCQPEDELVATTSRAISTTNGADLNGADLNGADLNGADLNGADMNGADLNGFTLNGTYLSGTTATGTTLTGSGLVGVTFNGVTVSGQSVRLRIDSFTQGTGSNADVYYYGLSWKDSP